MFKKLKEAKQEREKALKIMTDFVEGRITTEVFWEQHYKTNEIIRNLIINDEKQLNGSKQLFLSMQEALKNTNLQILHDRVEVFRRTANYFRRREIKLDYKNKDSELYGFLLDIQPDWLELQDEEFLLGIYNSAPNDLSESKKKEYCKARIRELFKYDKKPPEWLQSGEWAIVNGKPLVFSHQETAQDSDHELYYFYDAETKEEIIVEQYT